jgi:hypothetical protein
MRSYEALQRRIDVRALFIRSDIHKPGSTDPVIGLKVKSVQKVLEDLASRGIEPDRGPVVGLRGEYAELRDPDGRAVIITEAD